MPTTDKTTAVAAVQTAVEAAMAAVEQYLATATAPTAEAAQAVITRVLDQHDCESPEGLIVAGGVASVEPYEMGSGALVPGVPIVIDIFPRSRRTGYFADMTRTVCIGDPPAELQRMYDTVVAAQDTAYQMVAPGVATADIHIAAAEYFVQQGFVTAGKGKEFTYAEGFVHALGHGVGTSVHQAPSLSPRSTDTLTVGDIITIEPGLYYPHIGGVRMEDMVLVTEDGCRNLTTYKKQLHIPRRT